MRPLLLSAILLAACTGTKGGTDDDGGDTEDNGDADTGASDDGAADDGGLDEASLYGSVPDEALAAPEFSATHHDGSARSREDLLGHPTVMWFYPAAGTYG